MGKVIIKSLILFLALTLLFSVYTTYKEVIKWLPWYINGAEVKEVNGVVNSFYWHGGKSACDCWVIQVQDEANVLFLKSYNNSYSDKHPEINTTYLFKYQTSPEEKDRTISIYDHKSQLGIYNADKYDGFGLAIVNVLVGTLKLILSIFLFIVLFERFKKYIKYPE